MGSVVAATKSAATLCLGGAGIARHPPAVGAAVVLCGAVVVGVGAFVAVAVGTVGVVAVAVALAVGGTVVGGRLLTAGESRVAACA